MGTMLSVARRGPSYPVTAEWKEEAIQRMQAREYTRAELASKVGCTEAALSQLFGSGMMASSLVPRVHRALGWPMQDTPPTWNKDVVELNHTVARLSDQQVKLILATAKALLAASEPAGLNKYQSIELN
jgi:hypothetical protein